MAHVLITGSADGLGRLAADALHAAGHDVVVHVRGDHRRDAVADLVDAGASVVVGDLSDAAATRDVAEQANALGRFDAVVHNAGVIGGDAVIPVNVLAPYVLTALIETPARLVYLSSSMHRGGRASLDVLDGGSYSDSKLLVTTLALAVARQSPDVRSNAVDPGWVPTRMGGSGASDDLEAGHRTQAWLAVSDDAEAQTTGGYWYHRSRHDPRPETQDTAFQDRLLDALAERTGVTLG